ncbi:MAG TPA: DNA polymerase I [Burkholderiales bacterium]|nr:DNA polymerase I [Burkholderiales bacterium]
MSGEKLLLLVDGSSYLYRAFHALPDLRNPAGEPTGAIYGVLSMLRRLLADHKAEFLACVFDPRGKTFRDDIYPEYKANRSAMPEDLGLQIAPLCEAVQAMGWPVVVIDGVEADDVIGTLAAHATAKGVRTVVSTGDKDLAQLVNEQVTLVNTMSNETLDPAGVQNKFGVPPERIIDYLTLVGDAVDNIPGVDKCGPKTAVKWIAEYGSLDGVIQSAASVKGVVGENLRKALEWLPRGRELVTVKCDVPLPFDFDALALKASDDTKLAELYQRFGFKTWLKDVQKGNDAAGPTATEQSLVPPSVSSPAPPEDVPRYYELLLTEVQLEPWLERLNAATLCAVDSETTSLDPLTAQLVGISFSTEAGHAAYLAFDHRYPGAPDQIGVERALALLRPWLEDESKKKVGQNLKYDQHVFANYGVTLRGIAHDTLLQHYVLESHLRHDLDTLAQRYLQVSTISYDDVTGKGAQRIGFEEVDVQRAMEYSAEDSDLTLRVHQVMYPQVQADEKLQFVYEEIEMPVREVLFRMERNGVLIDAALLETQSHELGQKMLALEERAYGEAGQPFNLNSPKQICEILFERLQIPVIKKTPSGAPSTDEEVLEKLALDYPLPKTLLEYRGLTKLKSTYTDKLPRMVNAKTGRVHTNYGQATAVTGRLASNDPNLQNIPVRTGEGRRIREAFVAPPGSLIVSADYSQVELRIMAHFSGDEGLVRAFAEERDIHRATAAEVFGRALEDVSPEERRYAKVINFGLIYGMSAFGLAQNLGVERATAQAYIDSYFARYPGVARYMESTRQTAREQGYVETVFGRRLWLAEIRSANAMRRAGAERAAINAPMQGTAADLIKLAMIAVQGWIEREGLQSKLVMQVHDELVLEVPENELALVKSELPKLMNDVAQLRVPLGVEVGVGKNWEEAH